MGYMKFGVNFFFIVFMYWLLCDFSLVLSFFFYVKFDGEGFYIGWGNCGCI